MTEYERGIREEVLQDFLQEFDKEYHSFLIDEAVGKVIAKLRKKYAL